MPNTPLPRNECSTVTKGRRTTLPTLLEDFQENDLLHYKKVEGGYFVSKVYRLNNEVALQKKVLYGVMIGQSKSNQRWFGIVIDVYGLIKLRISSSTEIYLFKDLVELTEQKWRDKLNEKCGVDQWSFPILIKPIEYKTLPEDALNTVRECWTGLQRDSWPPKSSRTSNPMEDYFE